MCDKKISIITPTYNRAWCIERMIHSVLNQNNPNWELIIVDGASDDNTEDVITNYLGNKRIQYVRSNANLGVNVARNMGLDLITGDYLVFLDSDDELKDDAVEVLINKFGDHADTSVLVFDCVDNFGKSTGSCNYKEQKITFADVIIGQKFGGEKFIAVNADIFENKKYRFPELPGGLESILWYDIAKDYDFLLINKVLRIYHTEHDDRITGSNGIMKRAKYMPELYNILLSKFDNDFIKYNPKKLGYFYLEKAIFELLNGNIKIGRGDICMSIRYNHNKFFVCSMIYAVSYLPTFLFVKLIVFGHSFKKVIHGNYYENRR